MANHFNSHHPDIPKIQRLRYLREARVAGSKGLGKKQTPAFNQPSIEALWAEKEMGTGDNNLSRSPSPTRKGKGKGRKGGGGRKKGMREESHANNNEGKSKGKRKETRGESKEKRKGESGGSKVRKVKDGDNEGVKEKGKVTMERGPKTKDYPRFELKSSNFLTQLLSFATSRFGFHMKPSAAEEMVVDINKYLHFASGGECEDVKDLYNTEKVLAYIQKCEGDGVESAGLHTKLSRIKKGLQHAVEKYGWEEDKGMISTALQAYERRKKNLQREKTTLSKKTALQRSEEVEQASLDNYCQLLTMTRPRDDAVSALGNGLDISDDGFNSVTSYIAVQLLLRHSARVSAIEGMTMEEFRRARREERTDGTPLWAVSVRAHKTASTKGPTALFFDADLHDITEKYLAIRVGKGRESDILLVNHGGKPPSRLSRQLQVYAKSYDISLPTPTMHRKVIGTKASSLAQEKQEKVAALMCHSLPTQQRYYRMLEGKEDSKQAYQIMQELLPVPQPEKPGTSTAMQTRYVFSKEANRKIKEYFQKGIEEKTLPRLAECARFLGVHPMEGRNAKHIQDKVKTFIRQSGK